MVSLLITGAHILVTLRDFVLQESKGTILGMLPPVCRAVLLQLSSEDCDAFCIKQKLCSKGVFLWEG